MTDIVNVPIPVKVKRVRLKSLPLKDMLVGQSIIINKNQGYKLVSVQASCRYWSNLLGRDYDAKWLIDDQIQVWRNPDPGTKALVEPCTSCGTIEAHPRWVCAEYTK